MQTQRTSTERPDLSVTIESGDVDIVFFGSYLVETTPLIIGHHFIETEKMIVFNKIVSD